MRIFVWVLGIALLCRCGEHTSSEIPSVQSATIEKHISELSSDYYLGRKPFTDGEERTVNYLVDQLKAIGIAPGHGDSYLQDVPMVEIKGTSSPQMMLNSPQGDITLNYREDFVSYSERLQKDIAVNNSEVVFCGFGVVAPEYGWNDYEGLDVKGKTVIVLVNDPGFGSDDESFFKGNAMTYYGRWTYKYEEAARQGAAAILIVHETTSAGYPWFVVESSWSGGHLALKPEGDNSDQPAVQGWLTLDATQKIFSRAGFDLATEIRKARTADFKPFTLRYQMSHSLQNDWKFDVSQNVVGMIKGASRPDEVIIYSAHWDHLGIGQVVDGDSIYNGGTG